jgi:hypothetical protein
MLTDRWKTADYSDRIWQAEIRNFANKAKTLRMVVEQDRSGKCEAAVFVGDEQLKVASPVCKDLDTACHACLRAVRKHFQDRRTGSYVLQFLPYKTDREIRIAFGVTQSSASDWRRIGMRMSRGRATYACMLMGVKGYGRGGRNGGEVLRLEAPEWEAEFTDKKGGRI